MASTTKTRSCTPTRVCFRRVTYLDALNRGLKVMDSTAISLCMDNRLPIVVFGMESPGTLRRLALGEDVGTLVSDGPTEMA
jgi:uridylate kinase